ncbi:MAG TPA: hypothetical protein VHL59_20115 [Thermoanaerobaculia bacterium]|nr:hypothetical protein [Thermoanaerobaculia bacterium]
MPKPLKTLLAELAQTPPPRVLLVGGSSDFLSEQAFHDIRDAIVAKNPGISVETYEPGGSWRRFSIRIARCRSSAARGC